MISFDFSSDVLNIEGPQEMCDSDVGTASSPGDSDPNLKGDWLTLVDSGLPHETGDLSVAHLAQGFFPGFGLKGSTKPFADLEVPGALVQIGKDSSNFASHWARWVEAATHILQGLLGAIVVAPGRSMEISEKSCLVDGEGV